tara:strand:- start:49 stop:999 length:951 start_codon:yes stop_codon:yes gene_type:complete
MSNNTSIISPPPFEYFGGTANMSRASSSEHPGTNSFNSTASGDDCTLLETIENIQSIPDAAGDTGDASSPQGPDGNEDLSPAELFEMRMDAIHTETMRALDEINGQIPGNPGSSGDVTNDPGSGNTPGEDLGEMNNSFASNITTDYIIGNLNRESNLIESIFQGDGTGGIDLSQTDFKVFGDVKVNGPLSTQFYGQFGFQNGESKVGVSTQLNLDILKCDTSDVGFVTVVDINSWGSEYGIGLNWTLRDVETKEANTEFRVLAYSSTNEFLNDGDRDNGVQIDLNRRINKHLSIKTTVEIDAEGNPRITTGLGLSF